MEISKIIYEGKLRTIATHLASGSSIVTDAPRDNEGKGEAFSPTDLMSTALASCMITIMGIKAAKEDIPFEKVQAIVHKFMGTNPRRVVKIKVELEISGRLPDESQRIILEEAGLNCPVAKSLHPEIEQEIHFRYS
jgi:putative redox protein